MKPINGINPNMLKRLTVEDIRQMREMRIEGIDVMTLARTFNVNRTTVEWHTAPFKPEIDSNEYPHRRFEYRSRHNKR